MNHLRRSVAIRRKAAGFSLVELLIALLLGLIIVSAFGTVYFSSQSTSRRLEQLSSMQQGVRTAFEFFTSDVHAVGLTGCQQGRATGLTAAPSVNLADNFGVSIEGFNSVTAPEYPLSADAGAATWNTNITATGTVTTLNLAFANNPNLTAGSDVLFLRTVGSRPLRLRADASASLVPIEAVSLGGGNCSAGGARSSGFCAGNWALIADCTKAQVFQVAGLANVGGILQLTSTTTIAGTYATATSEVFPLQTVMYYVRTGSNGTPSLYRRIFDGDDGTTFGEEQELIENVETLQVTYGLDSDDTGGVRNYGVDAYVTANAVTDWTRVLSVRMSILLRGPDPVRGEAEVALSGTVNGVEVTYPTDGDKFDRRVFTTTVALRNRIEN